MWFDGLTDDEYKIYNRYYIKKLRENPEKKEAEKKYNSENKSVDLIFKNVNSWYRVVI